MLCTTIMYTIIYVPNLVTIDILHRWNESSHYVFCLIFLIVMNKTILKNFTLNA